MPTDTAPLTPPALLPSVLGTVVLDAMRRRDLSQRALAAASGVPLVTLSRRLTGELRGLTLVELIAIAGPLGVRPSELLAAAEDDRTLDLR